MTEGRRRVRLAGSSGEGAAIMARRWIPWTLIRLMMSRRRREPLTRVARWNMHLISIPVCRGIRFEMDLERLFQVSLFGPPSRMSSFGPSAAVCPVSMCHIVVTDGSLDKPQKGDDNTDNKLVSWQQRRPTLPNPWIASEKATSDRSLVTNPHARAPVSVWAHSVGIKRKLTPRKRVERPRWASWMLFWGLEVEGTSRRRETQWRRRVTRVAGKGRMAYGVDKEKAKDMIRDGLRRIVARLALNTRGLFTAMIHQVSPTNRSASKIESTHHPSSFAEARLREHRLGR